MSLQHLISEARSLAGDVPCGSGHAWESLGGRQCPKGLFGCSQTVYRCTRCGGWDHGEKGGHAHQECFKDCPRQVEPDGDEE